jgi:hypothetical protein
MARFLNIAAAVGPPYTVGRGREPAGVDLLQLTLA